MKHVRLLMAGVLLSGVVLGQVSTGGIQVIGEALKPGVYVFTANMTFLQLVSKAGGFTRDANKKEARIYRIHKGDQPGVPDHVETIRLDTDSILRGQQPDIPLKPGDVVVFPARESSSPKGPEPAPPIRIVPLDLALNL